MCGVTVLYSGGGQCWGRDDHRSTQCLYISAAENQPRPARHALVQQRRYGNTTTLTADDKFSTTLPRGRAANATQQTDGTIEVPGCQDFAYLQGRC